MALRCRQSALQNSLEILDGARQGAYRQKRKNIACNFGEGIEDRRYRYHIVVNAVKGAMDPFLLDHDPWLASSHTMVV